MVCSLRRGPPRKLKSGCRVRKATGVVSPAALGYLEKDRVSKKGIRSAYNIQRTLNFFCKNVRFSSGLILQHWNRDIEKQ